MSAVSDATRMADDDGRRTARAGWNRELDPTLRRIVCRSILRATTLQTTESQKEQSAMILIGQYDSPFVRRVAIALTHYGLPFEHRPWSVWGHADAIAKFNPLRRVPVLALDNGEVLVESSAILDAIDEMLPPEQALLPRSGAARRAGLRVCGLATGLADKAVSLLYEGVLRLEPARNATWIDRCQTQMHDTLDLLESERASRPGPFWLEAFSHADIAVACALRFVREAHPALLQSRPRPWLAAQAERCESMDLFQRVVQPLHVQI